MARTASYALTESERRYVCSGDTGSYTEARIEDQIQSKIEKLDERLNRLLSDVDILRENGYLNAEHWDETWTDLIGFGDNEFAPKLSLRPIDEENDSPTHADIVDAVQLSPQYSSARPRSAAGELGRDLGRFAYQLMLVPESVEAKAMMKNIAYGFLEGCYFDNRPAGDPNERSDYREQVMGELLESLEERLEKELEQDERLEEWHASLDEASEAWDEVRWKMRRRIRDLIDDLEVPLFTVSPDIMERAQQPDDWADQQFGIQASFLEPLLIDHVTESGLDPDDPTVSDTIGTSGQVAQFQIEHGPTDELDVNEIVTRENLLTIISDYELVTRERMAPLVEEDKERIEEMSWRSIEANDVLQALDHADGNLSSTEIAKELRTSSHKGTVTKLCNDLAGRALERPLVKGNNGDWSLTPYGRVVASGAQLKPKFHASDRDAKLADLVANAAPDVGIETWDH